MKEITPSDGMVVKSAGYMVLRIIRPLNIGAWIYYELLVVLP